MDREQIENSLNNLESLQQAYNKVFDSVEGRRVLEDLERVTLLNTTTFNSDALIMAFQEGGRAVMLHINSMRKMNIKLMKEVQDDG